MDSREEVVDLESGGATTSDNGDYQDGMKGKHLLRHVPRQGMDLDEVIATPNVSALAAMISNNKHSFISGEDATMINVENNARVKASVEEKTSRDRRQMSMGSKKPRKPPLPPGGRWLSKDDIKLVREISQLSRLRHARDERIKALKKKRAEKASSSQAGVFATIITILFICVIFSSSQADEFQK
ncbi:hypothetical protein V6N13_141169 [Hibiscus sabdariffa]|uniref:Transmembrane protein n=1 Tax=Hibiscus sabdariffa TaxID=183260 RepID=A0ABR2Q0Q6_9ROSI